MTAQPDIVIESGVELDVPLNKLKKSPKNVRRVPHGEAAIEALAASIGAKRMLQPLVVEPELRADGAPTGAYLVTIGEGRRLAQRLRAKRGEIARGAPIRCVVETALDAGEISLDENVTRSAMHPADEFEAFRELAERRGFGPEEIAARFGVSPEVVKRRLRLGAASPKLLAAYRGGELTLDQVMAFAVSEDHARQEQVFEQFASPAQASPHAIRRAMTEAQVPAEDRRVRLIGLDTYAEAGGRISRDLFTEDGGGWLEDVGLLDRLVAAKLEATAGEVRAAEGWKWAEAHLDYPHGHTCSRVYPQAVTRTDEETAQIAAIAKEYDALTQQWSHVEDLPPEVEARLAEIDAALEAFGDGYAYGPEEIARCGVLVTLGYDGTVRLERGLLRPEDAAASEPEPDPVGALEEASEPQGPDPDADPDEDAEGPAPLSDRLVGDLTAHRTMGLRDALAEHPDVALCVVVHAAVLRAFYPGATASCAEVRFASTPLTREADGIDDSRAAGRIADRHEGWARQMPQAAADAWAFVRGLDGDSRAVLLAHCVGLTLNAVHGWERRPQAWAHADALASTVGLDMSAYWSATARSYFGRVTKARIGEAVREAVSPQAAERIAGLKKPQMAEAAEQLLAEAGWLPPLLRTAGAAATDAADIGAHAIAAE